MGSSKRKPRSEAEVCMHCGKVVWPTRDSANAKVERMRATPGVRKPYLLDSYKCPKGLGWHIGHDYRLR